MSSYIWLLLLTICCWHCMAAVHSQEHSHEHPPHSKEHSHEHAPHSKEHSHEHASHEHASHSKEDSKEHSKEHASHSKEHSHSEELSSSEHKNAACTDGKKNNDETDIDCGGKKCAKCANEKTCKKNLDCISDICKDKKCAQKPTKPTQSTRPPTTTTPEPTTTTPEPTTTTPEPTTTTPEPTTTTPEPTTTTPEPTTTTPEPTTTTPEPTTTTPEPTTTTPEPTTTTPEPTTTTPEPTTTTPEPTTTTPEPTTTTPEPTTTTPEPTTTTPEPTTTTPELTTTLPTCDPECKNNGICTDHNVCTCTEDFSGPTCEIQSVGLCLNDDTFNNEPILLITFGNGSSQYSTAVPADFHFRTTYKQQFQPKTNDGMFSFVNSVHNDFNNAWHTNATDHSEDNGGYMYLVNADFTPGLFYNGTVDNLCIGLRYEFSVYLANLCKPTGKINPNVLFEVRSTDGDVLLAQLNSGDIVEHKNLTWEKYGLSFIAPSSSINLLLISNARGGSGNDLVIDDIALRVCTHGGTGFCPSK